MKMFAQVPINTKDSPAILSIWASTCIRPNAPILTPNTRISAAQLPEWPASWLNADWLLRRYKKEVFLIFQLIVIIEPWIRP